MAVCMILSCSNFRTILYYVSEWYHSFSNYCSQTTTKDFEYFRKPFSVLIEQFAALYSKVIHPVFWGLNLVLPFGQKMLQYTSSADTNETRGNR